MIGIPTKPLPVDKSGMGGYYCCMKKVPLIDITSTFAFRDFMKQYNHFHQAGERSDRLWIHSNGEEFLRYLERNSDILGIAIGTRVWPVFVKTDFDGNQVLLADIGDYDRTTKHEWYIDQSSNNGFAEPIIYDYDVYVLILFAFVTKDEGPDVETAGFFVPKNALYNAKARAQDIAKNGKAIMKRIEVQSSSNPKKKYEVLYYDDCTTSCNCPAWIFSKETPRACKHTKKIMLDIVNSNLTP
jgi:hypothetical protein